MKKLFYVFSITMLIMFSFFLCGCDSEPNYEGQIKVTFNLEGGEYRNSSLDFITYYKYEEGEKHVIYDPQELSGESVTRETYSFNGWYQTKTEVNGKVVYSDPWDFENDVVEGEELVLYAKWNKYTYVVGYKDEHDNFIVKGTYYVDAGEKFRDTKKYTSRNNYTCVGYEDIDGNTIDISTFTHPGDEQEEVKIVCVYIEGVYELISTASDLIKNKDKNIYLTADIDLEGKSFNFNNYQKSFLGNGHTIRNFAINYDASKSSLQTDLVDKSNNNSLMISLFGNCKGANIQDVNFENVSVDIKTTLSLTYKIYLAPLSVDLVSSTIKNVTFKGTYTISKLPEGMSSDSVEVANDRVYYQKDESSVVENTTVELVLKSQEE